MTAAVPAGPVSPEWQDRGTWLSQAWEVLGNLRHRAHEAVAQFEELMEGETPEMHLMSAGVEFPQWRKVARRIPLDEVRRAFVQYCAAREMAEQSILSQCRLGELFAFGSRRPGDDPHWIPTLALRDPRRDPDHRNDLRNQDIVWHDVRIISAEQWRTAVAEEKPVAETAITVDAPLAPDPPKPPAWRLRGAKLKRAWDAWLEELQPQVPDRREAEEHGRKHSWLIEGSVDDLFKIVR